ncbi:hypothetical protein K466DRAFT_275412 [Polyporus arcularius HHB13444]|uniref:Uncharacterized protein n=1 Tax=Polyporus arcularius HHB13444 TaxID=1314778 RepID=A0A5C3P383_9APHY|nr:hypothetical protein K466DRAFT_275412 [Polyporus arcularius HHB13444]
MTTAEAPASFDSARVTNDAVTTYVSYPGQPRHYSTLDAVARWKPELEWSSLSNTRSRSACKVPHPRPRGWRCGFKSLIATPNAPVEPQNRTSEGAASSMLCCSALPGRQRASRPRRVARSDISMDTEDEDPLLSVLRRGHFLRRFMATHLEATGTALAGMQGAIPTPAPASSQVLFPG